jgi:hypothetical protein
MAHRAQQVRQLLGQQQQRRIDEHGLRTDEHVLRILAEVSGMGLCFEYFFY